VFLYLRCIIPALCFQIERFFACTFPLAQREKIHHHNNKNKKALAFLSILLLFWRGSKSGGLCAFILNRAESASLEARMQIKSNKTLSAMRPIKNANLFS